MSELGFDYIETGMRFLRTQSAVLAEDIANARTPGFVARDAVRVQDGQEQGVPFSAVLRDVAASGATGVLEFAMGAQARNAVAYRTLADQEHAMLRELRTVAEEARR